MAKKKDAAKNKGGRPPKVLSTEDKAAIKSLATVYASWNEIADDIGWSTSTLQKNQEAKDIYHKGVSKGKTSLRRAQFRVALEGNPTMLIWLGKIHLNQKEVRDVVVDTDGPAHVTIGNYIGATDG